MWMSTCARVGVSLARKARTCVRTAHEKQRQTAESNELTKTITEHEKTRMCEHPVRSGIDKKYLRGACAPNPATEPNTRTMFGAYRLHENTSDSCRLVFRFSCVCLAFAKPRTLMISGDPVALIGPSWRISGVYRLHKNTGHSCRLVFRSPVWFLRAQNQEHN